MTLNRFPRSSAIVAGAAVLAVAAGSASAATTVFRLSDHPDGAVAPPNYGLRLDGMFAGMGGATGGIATFSFDHFNNTLMTVTESGGNLTINIRGTLWGGEKTGFGMGAWDLDFTFGMNVVADGTGFVVEAEAPLHNYGAMTALGANNGAGEGMVRSFHDLMSESFFFLQDEHRLAGHWQQGQGFWVGRGWVTYNAGGNSSTGTQDWLFLGQVIPTPMAAGLACAGLAGVVGLRRRRF